MGCLEGCPKIHTFEKTRRGEVITKMGEKRGERKVMDAGHCEKATENNDENVKE